MSSLSELKSQQMPAPACRTVETFEAFGLGTRLIQAFLYLVAARLGHLGHALGKVFDETATTGADD